MSTQEQVTFKAIGKMYETLVISTPPKQVPRVVDGVTTFENSYGAAIRFEKHVHTTSNPETIKFLREHPFYKYGTIIELTDAVMPNTATPADVTEASGVKTKNEMITYLVTNVKDVTPEILKGKNAQALYDFALNEKQIKFTDFVIKATE